MPTDDLNNIEAKLNFSKRLGGLIKGHQQEMQQVLDENEDLQMLVEQLLKENITTMEQPNRIINVAGHRTWSFIC